MLRIEVEGLMKTTLKIFGFIWMLGALAMVITITSNGYEMDMIRFMLLVNLSLVFMIFKLFFRRRKATVVISLVEIGVLGYFLKTFMDGTPIFLEPTCELYHQVFIVMIILSMATALFLTIVSLVTKDKKKTKIFSHGLY